MYKNNTKFDVIEITNASNIVEYTHIKIINYLIKKPPYVIDEGFFAICDKINTQ